MIEPFVSKISTQSLKWKLIGNAWRVVGPRTRTHVLARVLDDWFFGGQLEDLSSDCRFVFNTANLTTGVRFGFERDVFGDYVLGRCTTAGSGLRLADAVAASAAVPGPFPPLVLRDFEFPCAEGRIPKLVDGGAYDNSGLEAVDNLPDAFLIAINAGGLFRTGSWSISQFPVLAEGLCAGFYFLRHRKYSRGSSAGCAVCPASKNDGSCGSPDQAAARARAPLPRTLTHL